MHSLAYIKTRVLEFVTFGKNGFSGDGRESVGEAVAEVQVGCMAALSVPAKGHAGQFRLVSIHGDDFDRGLV